VLHFSDLFSTFECLFSRVPNFMVVGFYTCPSAAWHLYDVYEFSFVCAGRSRQCNLKLCFCYGFVCFSVPARSGQQQRSYNETLENVDASSLDTGVLLAEYQNVVDAKKERHNVKRDVGAQQSSGSKQ
jgi:hypothetical protein